MNRYRPLAVAFLLGVATTLAAVYGLLIAAANAMAGQERGRS